MVYKAVNAPAQRAECNVLFVWHMLLNVGNLERYRTHAYINTCVPVLVGLGGGGRTQVRVCERLAILFHIHTGDSVMSLYVRHMDAKHIFRMMAQCVKCHRSQYFVDILSGLNIQT